MTFLYAIQSGFRNYGNFRGRASRSAYWWWFLFSLIVQMTASSLNNSLSFFVSLALIIPSLSLSWRRMHDSGHNGFWSLLPIVNLVFALTPTEQAVNEYGPPAPPLSA